MQNRPRHREARSLRASKPVGNISLMYATASKSSLSKASCGVVDAARVILLRGETAVLPASSAAMVEKIQLALMSSLFATISSHTVYRLHQIWVFFIQPFAVKVWPRE